MNSIRRRTRVLLASILALAMLGIVSAAPTASSAAAPLEPQGFLAPHIAAQLAINEIEASGGRLGIDDIELGAALGPNPYTSIDGTHRSQAQLDAWARIAETATGGPIGATAVDPIIAPETEPSDGRGGNDNPGDAQLIDGFGTGSGDNDTAIITGTLQGDLESLAGPAIPTEPTCASTEDDGAIQLANDPGVSPDVAVLCTGEIGDGPFGDSSGDMDYFALGALEAGRSVVIEYTTVGDDNTIMPVVVLFDSAGAFVDLNLSDVPGADVTLELFVPADDVYTAFIVDFNTFVQDPFDSGSGTGAGNTGPYTVGISIGGVLPPTDIDFFAVDLEAGDVIRLGLDVEALGGAAIIGPDGVLRQASQGSAAFIYPASSPLRHGGSIGIDHIAATTGRYAIGVQGIGGYGGELFVSRPGLATTGGSAQQTLFVDFDGAFLNPAIFNSGGPDADIFMSPLSAFLAGWGLDASDENAVIDASLAVLEESLSAELRMHGVNGDRDASGQGTEFDIEILNSRDHGDMWGQPNVSRIIVGGTIDELGIPTVGIAQSIDPGNFDTEESGIVLLDLLSAPAEAGFVNAIPRAPGTSIIDAVAIAIGEIVAHEAGHYLGNWHTSNASDDVNVMDEGGAFFALFGLGADGVLGTADDVDVDFIEDVYSFNEGFSGIAQSDTRTAFGLSTGRMNVVADPPPFPDTIDLPEGFAGEGITDSPDGKSFFAGSLSDGRIAKGTLRSGEVEVFVSEPAIVPAVGLDADLKSGQLFVAGGPSGQAAAYDLQTGEVTEVFTFADPDTSFINDVIVTRDGAFFTDSFNPVLHVVPLDKNGNMGEPYILELSGPAGETAGQFNNNGIVARANGRQLIVINSSTGVLAVVNPKTGSSKAIDTGGVTFGSGDGMVLEGRDLYVLKNGAFPGTVNEVVHVKLRTNLLKGSVVRSFTDPLFETATTLIKFGPRFAVVNAQFAGAPIDDGFEVVITLGRP